MKHETYHEEPGLGGYFPGREKQGSAHRAERDLPDGKSLGFLRAAGCRKRRKFFPQPPGVRRMRRTG